MSDSNDTIMNTIRARSTKRRDVLKYAGQATAVAGGLALLSACGDDDALFGTPNPTPPATPTPTPAPVSTAKPGIPNQADIDTVNFLLNLVYAETAFYIGLAKPHPADGSGGPVLDPADVSGIGTLGTISVNLAAVTLSAADATSFFPPFAKEIARTSLARLRAIRAVLGSSAVACPTIDVTTPSWKVIADAGYALYPTAYAPSTIAALSNYAPQSGGPAYVQSTIYMNSVVLAAFRGALALVTSAEARALISGCIVGLSYHSAQLRTASDMQSQLAGGTTAKGADNAQIKGTRAFTLYINSLMAGGTPGTLDQSIFTGDGAVNGGANTAQAANIVETDANGIAISRTPQGTLNLLFLTNAAATKGGFFPAGLNGTITTSATH